MRDKVTIADIEAQIVKQEDFKLGVKTTVVLLTLANGFEVVGKSGCVDPKNYNHEIGVKVARERAIDQLWFLEGYTLQNEMSLRHISTAEQKALRKDPNYIGKWEDGKLVKDIDYKGECKDGSCGCASTNLGDKNE